MTDEAWQRRAREVAAALEAARGRLLVMHQELASLRQRLGRPSLPGPAWSALAPGALSSASSDAVGRI